MLFMIVERFRTPGARDVYRRARDKGRMMPDGLKYVASWVDLEFKNCWQLMEADNAEALDPWLEKWRDLVDFDVVPVRTSAEASELINPLL
jgi:hypothetical protein